MCVGANVCRAGGGESMNMCKCVGVNVCRGDGVVSVNVCTDDGVVGIYIYVGVWV